MNRRALLAALGTAPALLAGCQWAVGDTAPTESSPSAPSNRSTPDTDEPAATSPDSPPTRSVSLAGTGSVPSDANLSLTATLKRSRVTSDETALVTVRLTNTGAGRTIDVRNSEHCHLFNRGRGESDPPGLWLYRRQDAPENRVEGRWTQDLPAGNPHTFVALGCGYQRLPAGESITTTYEVWDDYATDGYFPSGTYRFDAPIDVRKSTTDEGDPRRVDWWFDLTVSDSSA